jgi:hypothetical protein
MMAIEKTYLEWFPAASQIFRIGFGAHDELIDAETHLDEDGNTPTVELHELTDEHPETWTDISSSVSISGIGVVDDDVNEMVDGAVQFRLAADTDNDPTPGDKYSFFIMADRADDATLQVATRVWLRIMP